MKLKLKQAVVALSAAVVLLSSAAQAVPRYSVTDLNTLGGVGSLATAYGINSSGQVVGAHSPNGFGDRAFIYSNGAMTDLGTLGGSESRAKSINDSGQVVGILMKHIGHTSYFQAFLYSDGASTGLGTLGGADSVATSINASGQVVGQSSKSFSNNFGGGYAFLYSGGTMTDLGTLDGDHSFAASIATGINASSQVVGTSTPSAGLPSHITRAFLYSSGVMTDLGTLGGESSSAAGINASGQVVGVADTTNGINYSHAFLYSGGIMADLGTLGGNRSAATGINSSGQVIGQSDIVGGGSTAFLYSDGVMTDLNSLIDPLAGWTISNAAAINDSGQIAANGCNTIGKCSALLLSPVPEPEIYLMMFAGLGLLGMKLRRRNSVWS